jgi:tRNA (guanine-N7-)-methyltransferase
VLPRIVLSAPASGHLDTRALFGQARQTIWLEIGFGGGEHLAFQAQCHPEVGLIGCEVFENGVAKLVAQIAHHGLDNIRIFTDDARLLMASLPPNSIDRVFILFPDPWPKHRHHKRRIVTREALDRLAEIMNDDAELRIATDDTDYLCWILERVTVHPGFEWLARSPGDWRERLSDWPSTRYEARARSAGRSPAFLRLRRRPRDGI